MFDFAFQKFFEIFWIIFIFFLYFKLIFFLCFCIIFYKKNMLRLSLTRSQTQEILKFQFFSLLQNNIFFWCFCIIFKIYYLKTYIEIVSGWEGRPKKFNFFFLYFKLIFFWYFGIMFLNIILKTIMLRLGLVASPDPWQQWALPTSRTHRY
jgi:hypothetical protein